MLGPGERLASNRCWAGFVIEHEARSAAPEQGLHMGESKMFKFLAVIIELLLTIFLIVVLLSAASDSGILKQILF